MLSHLVNNGAGAIVAEAGDVFVVTGNVGGDTTNRAAWNTAGAALEFAAGASSMHEMELSGVDLGADPGAGVGRFVAGQIAGNGFNLYFDPALAGNAWLGGGTYALGGGGNLSPLAAVPEPSTVALWLLGLAVLSRQARKAGG